MTASLPKETRSVVEKITLPGTLSWGEVVRGTAPSGVEFFFPVVHEWYGDRRGFVTRSFSAKEHQRYAASMIVDHLRFMKQFERVNNL